MTPLRQVQYRPHPPLEHLRLMKALVKRYSIGQLSSYLDDGDFLSRLIAFRAVPASA